MWLVRASRRVQRTDTPAISAQALAGLAEPYRGLLGEMVHTERDLKAEVMQAPETLRPMLAGLNERIARMLLPAHRKAQRGTQLKAQMLRLNASDPQHSAAQEAAQTIEDDLRTLLERVKELYSQTLRVVAEAQRLEPHTDPQRELDEAMAEVRALEEVFRDLGDTFGEGTREPSAPTSSRDVLAD